MKMINLLPRFFFKRKSGSRLLAMLGEYHSGRPFSLGACRPKTRTRVDNQWGQIFFLNQKMTFLHSQKARHRAAAPTSKYDFKFRDIPLSQFISNTLEFIELFCKLDS
jgi:hypothetical protein